MDKLIAQLKDITGSLPVNRAEALCAEALEALRASVERERELREALEPFIAVDALHRPTDLIRPVIADIQPMTVTVTKGQMRRARSILNKHKETA